MDRIKKIIGCPAATHIKLLVEDLLLFCQEQGGNAVFSPSDPLARMLLIQMLTVPPQGGGCLISSLASLGADSTAGSVGHVVPLNISTYIVTNQGIPIDFSNTNDGTDFISLTIKRIMTFGFPPIYTGVISKFNGYTPIDVSTINQNKNLIVGRIDTSVDISLPGTACYICNPISDAYKTTLIEDGWRFSDIVV